MRLFITNKTDIAQRFKIVLRHTNLAQCFEIALRHTNLAQRFEIVLRHTNLAQRFEIVLRHTNLAQRFEIVVCHTNLTQSTLKDANFFRNPLGTQPTRGGVLNACPTKHHVPTWHAHCIFFCSFTL